MRKSFSTTTCFLLASFMAEAQIANNLTTIAIELFKGVKTTLSITEKNFISQKTGFVLSGDKGQPFALDKDSKEYPFAANVLPVDLNKDGKEEVFILFGNGFTSGNTGSSVVLFIKNATGAYEMNFGFPGVMPDVLTSSNQGFPDILIGGPGMEYPVFRWNGKLYDNYRMVKDSDYGRLKKTSVEQLSKEYVGMMK